MLKFKKTLKYLLLLISLDVFSQNNVIDSLKSELKTYNENNIKKAELLHDIGMAYFETWDFETAILNFKNSTDIYISKGEIESAAIGLEYLGHAYTEINNFDKALFNYTSALNLYKKTKNESNVAGCLCNIGILYAEKTNILPAALKYYNASLELSTKIKDSLTMLKVLNNIGNLYEYNQNYEKAIEYFNKSQIIQNKTGRDIYLGITLNNLGNIYKKQKKYEKALLILNDAVTKSKKLNDKYTEATSLINIGGIYQVLEKYNLAIQYFNEGKLIMQEIKSDYGIHGSYIGLGHCLAETKQFKEALEYAKKADEISKQLGIIGLQKDVYELYSIVYKKSGNYKKGLEAFEKFKILSDSLFNKEKIEKVVQLELEYKYKQTLDSAYKREILLSNKVKNTSQNLEKTQRNILLTIIVFLLTIIALAGIIFYLKYRNQKIITHNIAIEQELLRSQMTPHFIFNSLSVLQGMILNKEEKKSINYLSKFSKLFRIILENSREKLVLLSKELEAIEHYLTLQNFEDNTYNYSISIDSTLKVAQFKIPPMLIQPFVENAIEHAFESSILDKKIDIYLAFLDKKLICIISDNGIGVDISKEKNNKNKKSLATTITTERLEILSKDIKIKSSIKIEDRKIYNEQGTKVTIEIPYIIIEST